MSETVTRRIPGTNRLETWDLECIRTAAEAIPITMKSVGSIPEVSDPDCWLNCLPDLGHPLVKPELCEMWSSHGSDPLILHPSWWVMDGYHRLGKLILEGVVAVPVREFSWDNLPPPLGY